MDIQEYCDALNIEIVVTYFPNQRGRWCARFVRCEFKNSAQSVCLISWHGNGGTPEAAILDFLDKIRGKIMVVEASSDTRRREYVVPDSLGMCDEQTGRK